MKVFLVWCWEYDDVELMGVYKFSPKAEAVVHSLAREYNESHAAETDEYPPMAIGKTNDGFIGYSSPDWNHRVVMGAIEVNEDVG